MKNFKSINLLKISTKLNLSIKLVFTFTKNKEIFKTLSDYSIKTLVYFGDWENKLKIPKEKASNRSEIHKFSSVVSKNASSHKILLYNTQNIF